jgi:hypothetical protein
MNQIATVRTSRGTVHPVPDRMKSTRMRLHLPRRLARHELRAWLAADALEDIDVVNTWPSPAGTSDLTAPAQSES